MGLLKFPFFLLHFYETAFYSSLYSRACKTNAKCAHSLSLPPYSDFLFQNRHLTTFDAAADTTGSLKRPEKALIPSITKFFASLFNVCHWALLGLVVVVVEADRRYPNVDKVTSNESICNAVLYNLIHFTRLYDLVWTGSIESDDIMTMLPITS